MTRIPSHPRTRAPAHPRTRAPARPRALAPSHPRTVARPRALAPSYPRTLAPSYASRPLLTAITQSRSCRFTRSRTNANAPDTHENKGRVVFGDGHPAIDYLLLLAVADDFFGILIVAIFYNGMVCEWVSTRTITT